jgi:hypothetical protein
MPAQDNQTPKNHNADSGVRLRTGKHPTLINAQGKSFVAKGVVYYQPTASHHYFLRGLDLKRVPQDLQQLKTVGFNTLTLDIAWGELFAEVDPQQGYKPIRIHQTLVNKLLKLIGLARKHGFYVYILPADSCVPPQVPAIQYKAVVDNAGIAHPPFKGYMVYNWRVDTEVNQGFLAFLGFLAETLKAFDHIIGYALAHETMDQTLPWCRSDQKLLHAWHRYLKDRNSKVNYWKKRWNEEKEPYKSIEEIQLPYRDLPLWESYYKGKKISPRESHPFAWQDYCLFTMIAIGLEGRYGLSFPEIAKTIRRGDPDALVIWKPFDPMRYAWELGYLREYKKGKLPPKAQETIKTIYSYPGIDIIACSGYPKATTDTTQRNKELSFQRQAEFVKALRKFTNLPIYCSEFGIDHQQWSQEERTQFLSAGIRQYQSLGLIGYNIWQSHDFYGGGLMDRTQPKFGLFDLKGNPYPAVDAIRHLMIEK